MAASMAPVSTFQNQSNNFLIFQSIFVFIFFSKLLSLTALYFLTYLLFDVWFPLKFYIKDLRSTVFTNSDGFGLYLV